jgi:hypothetical protein
MKKFILLFAILFLFVSGSALAEEGTVQYKVTIAVTYNAVSPEMAAKIQKIILHNHGSACSVEVVAKKISDGDFLYYSPTLTLEDDSTTLTLEETKDMLVNPSVEFKSFEQLIKDQMGATSGSTK